MFDDKTAKFLGSGKVGYVPVQQKTNYHLNYGLHFKRNNKNPKENLAVYIGSETSLDKNDKVLDIGCGMGGLSILLSEIYGSEIVGIDKERELIKAGKKLKRIKSLKNRVEFYKRDFLKEGIPRNGFDVILAIHVLSQIADKRKFLNRCKKILNENGRIIIIDSFLTNNLNKDDINKIKKWLEGWSMLSLSNVDDFEKCLKKSGLKNVNSKDLKKYVEPSLQYFFLISTLGYPFGKMLEFFYDNVCFKLDYIKYSYYRYITFKKGFWTVKSFMVRNKNTGICDMFSKT